MSRPEFADHEGGVPGAGQLLFRGAVVMRLLELTTRLVAIVLAGAVTGCVLPADPFVGGRQLPLPTALAAEKRTPSERSPQPAPTQQSIKQTSAVAQPESVKQASVEALAASTGPGVFSPEEALRFALQNNPLLQVVRQ